MDTTDPDIEFDEIGVCNHCHSHDDLISRFVHSGEAGRAKLDTIVSEIKREGRGKRYDCIIGVSGGVDSSYVAYKVKELGLRPLAVHLDNGWNSELAVKNIEHVLRKLDIDLYTEVLDWEEFRDLQLAFLRASTPDSEIPTDHAIVSVMSRMAEKIGTRYIMRGFNFRTETHLPRAWSQGHWDWRYIRSVHRAYGTRPLRRFPHLTLVQHHRYQLTQTFVDVLNYLDYVKADAMQVLERDLGWRYYGGKHYESIYTRFYQGYILPRKFGFDKRKTHLSALVCSGEVTREEALRELEGESYPASLQQEDLVYVTKKLGVTIQEFEEIMALPPRRFRDFPSYTKFYEGPFYQRLLALNRVARRWRRAFA